MGDTWKESLREDLECTICLELSVSPIFNCTNGHIICGICFDKVKKCGLCQETLIPCGFAERLVRKHEIEVPCRNLESGCLWLIKSTEMKSHMRVCDYRSIVCFEKRKKKSCQKLCTLSEFYDHLLGDHKITKLTPTSAGAFTGTFNCQNIGPIDEPLIRRVFSIEFNENKFLLHSVLDGASLCWWITVIGGQNEAESYDYISKIGSKSSRKTELTWRLPVLSLHKYNSFENVVYQGHFASVYYETIVAMHEAKDVKASELNHSWSVEFDIINIRMKEGLELP